MACCSSHLNRDDKWGGRKQGAVTMPAAVLHTNEDFMLPGDAPERARGQILSHGLKPVEQAGKPEGWPMDRVPEGWEFTVAGTGFEGRLRVELEAVPETGAATPLANESTGELASSLASAGVPGSAS